MNSLKLLAPFVFIPLLIVALFVWLHPTPRSPLEERPPIGFGPEWDCASSGPKGASFCVKKAPPTKPSSQQAISAPTDPPGKCAPDADAALTQLRGKSKSELDRLAFHFSFCEFDHDARVSVLEELARRGDGGAAYSLAAIYKYSGARDRGRSERWARQAIRLGESRGQTILDEWATGDRLRDRR